MSKYPLIERVAYPVADAARAIGVHVEHIKNALKLGEIEGHSIGIKTLIVREDLVAWIRAHPRKKLPSKQSQEAAP